MRQNALEKLGEMSKRKRGKEGGDGKAHSISIRLKERRDS